MNRVLLLTSLACIALAGCGSKPVKPSKPVAPAKVTKPGIKQPSLQTYSYANGKSGTGVITTAPAGEPSKAVPGNEKPVALDLPVNPNAPKSDSEGRYYTNTRDPLVGDVVPTPRPRSYAQASQPAKERLELQARGKLQPRFAPGPAAPRGDVFEYNIPQGGIQNIFTPPNASEPVELTQDGQGALVWYGAGESRLTLGQIAGIMGLVRNNPGADIVVCASSDETPEDGGTEFIGGQRSRRIIDAIEAAGRTAEHANFCELPYGFDQLPTGFLANAYSRRAEVRVRKSFVSSNGY